MVDHRLICHDRGVAVPVQRGCGEALTIRRRSNRCSISIGWRGWPGHDCARHAVEQRVVTAGVQRDQAEAMAERIGHVRHAAERASLDGAIQRRAVAPAASARDGGVEIVHHEVQVDRRPMPVEASPRAGRLSPESRSVSAAIDHDARRRVQLDPVGPEATARSGAEHRAVEGGSAGMRVASRFPSAEHGWSRGAPPLAERYVWR